MADKEMRPPILCRSDREFIAILKDANKKLSAHAKEKEARAEEIASVGHLLAIELECLLMDTQDLPVVSKWRDGAMGALEQWRELHTYKELGHG